MTHPHHLHATTAAWSLTAARHQLDIRVADEAADRAALAAEVKDGLRSRTYGGGHGLGGHADPVGTVALLDGPDRRPSRWARLAASTTSTLAWLADSLHAPVGGDEPLARLQTAIPSLQPGTARDLNQWLAEADDRIRVALGLDPDQQPLPGLACPSCGIRRLALQTAAPVRDRTVVCAAGCRCAGTGCTCRMPITVEGVPHIWPAALLLRDNSPFSETRK